MPSGLPAASGSTTVGRRAPAWATRRYACRPARETPSCAVVAKRDRAFRSRPPSGSARSGPARTAPRAATPCTASLRRAEALGLQSLLPAAPRGTGALSTNDSLHVVIGRSLTRHHTSGYQARYEQHVASPIWGAHF